ncbi:MAG: methionine--tRNA ligase [Alphaproteobacteria bacterium]|nr:methionine--tRNA ligase [Alphaproteobacteria bacterium]
MAAVPDAFYITTPIYYVNDVPHIGHAYTTLACDVMARFHRLDGKRVMFLTGTDEHGQKVEKSAQAAGMDPLVFCDKVSRNFRDLSSLLGFSNNDFIRTTEERHTVACQALWRAVIASGNNDIYLGKYAGWYSVRDEAFYGEDELIESPKGKLAPSGAPVEWVEEPSYFFRLSAWRDRLLAYYDSHPDFILPAARRNEVVSFVKSGLRDLSLSRTSFKWGIPVPDAPGHIMYVWFDALTNYVTAVGYPDTGTASFKTFWPALHVVGKDILRFHAVYWPAFLMAAGVEPPARVFAHGWWTIEGQKMSKSLGNFIAPSALVGKYGLDAVRYFLMRELPFGADGDYSHRAMVGRLNGDLANDLGNLVQRVLSFVAKNCGAKVPSPGTLTTDDDRLLDASETLLDRARALIDRQELHLVLEEIWRVIGDANRYVDAQAPWALRKSDPLRMATVLYVLAETIRRIAILVQPFMPTAAGRILDQLAVPGDRRTFTALVDAPALVPGVALPKPEGVFPRYVEAAA